MSAFYVSIYKHVGVMKSYGQDLLLLFTRPVPRRETNIWRISRTSNKIMLWQHYFVV